ncbi:MAG TPA: hypothetical protein ENI27_03570 [bacterium]|nr:hypothetical protein [bacterium]
MGFWDRIEETINQGLQSSREVLKQAKDKARDLGEKGVLKYEMAQLERQAEKKLAQLGTRVYGKLVDKGQATVSREVCKDLVDDILDLKKRVEDKEEAYKKIN